MTISWSYIYHAQADLVERWLSLYFYDVNRRKTLTKNYYLENQVQT